MYMTFLTLPFSHIHIRVPATAQQLLKHIFGASMKSFPRQPQSSVGYDSICLCGNCPGRTEPTLLKRPFSQKTFSYTKCSGKGHAGVSLFFSHALYLPSLYILHLICLHMQHTHHNSFYAWVQ